MMRLSNMNTAVTKNGTIIIGILFIIAVALVPMKPINLIKEDGNVETQLSEVFDTVKKLHVNTVNGKHRKKRQPIVWIRIDEKNSKEMFSVLRVFERLGFRQGSQFSQWDILWSYQNVFPSLESLLREIGPHQKVNHIPGVKSFQNKKFLATSIDIKSIPKAFSLPDQSVAFQKYAEEHPDYMWVQKNDGHRGVGLIQPNAIGSLMKKSRIFVQRYVDNPLLIDGKRFDIGVYVAVTSGDPLRVYMHDIEWVFRVCPEDYYPFDPKKAKKYVIANDHITGWKLPTFKKLVIERGFNYKEAVLSYMRTHGYNDTKVLENLHKSVQDVFMKIQHQLVIEPSSNLSNRNFFDISRFDFLIDNDTNVHLLEANLSPDLASTYEQFKGHEIMHEQVVYSLLTMIGTARNTQEHYMRSSNDTQHMMASERNINVYSDLCVSSQCENNCQEIYCNLCRSCIDENFSSELKSTVMEHNHKGAWKRIVPRIFKDPTEAKNWDPQTDPNFQNSTSKNKQMAAWIRGKCIRDNRWCI